MLEKGDPFDSFDAVMHRLYYYPLSVPYDSNDRSHDHTTTLLAFQDLVALPKKNFRVLPKLLPPIPLDSS